MEGERQKLESFFAVRGCCWSLLESECARKVWSQSLWVVGVCWQCYLLQQYWTWFGKLILSYISTKAAEHFIIKHTYQQFGPSVSSFSNTKISKKSVHLSLVLLQVFAHKHWSDGVHRGSMLQKRLDSQISTLVKTVKVPVKGGGEAPLQKSRKIIQ